MRIQAFADDGSGSRFDPIQIQLGEYGNVVNSPVGSGTKPQLLTILVHFKRRHYFGVTWGMGSVLSSPSGFKSEPTTLTISMDFGKQACGAIWIAFSSWKMKTSYGIYIYLYSGTVIFTATVGCRSFCSTLPIRSVELLPIRHPQNSVSGWFGPSRS